MMKSHLQAASPAAPCMPFKIPAAMRPPKPFPICWPMNLEVSLMSLLVPSNPAACRVCVERDGMPQYSIAAALHQPPSG